MRAASPPYQPGITRLRTRATQHALVPSVQAAAGSGLLGESQLSGRTECARPAPPNKPRHARLRTRATQQAIVSSEQASRRLWTAVSHHSSRGARSARGQPLRKSPGTRGSVLAPLPTRRHDALRKIPLAASRNRSTQTLPPHTLLPPLGCPAPPQKHDTASKIGCRARLRNAGHNEASYHFSIHPSKFTW